MIDSTTLALFVVLTAFISGILAGLVGLVVGAKAGIKGHLFFREEYKEFLHENMKQAESELQDKISAVNHEIDKSVANANAQVAKIYKQAAESLGSPGKLKVPPTGLN